MTNPSKEVTIQRAWLERLFEYGEMIEEAKDLFTKPLVFSGDTSQEVMDGEWEKRQVKISSNLSAVIGYIESIKFILENNDQPKS